MNVPSPALNLVVLRSVDIDRLVQFYETIGLRFTKHRHGNGPEHYASEENGFVFEIYPVGTSAQTVATRIGFSVDDVDTDIQRLTEVGAIILATPKDSPWGRRAVVRDFDGHTVELVQYFVEDKSENGE